MIREGDEVCDYTLQRAGTIFVLWPHNQPAKRWLDQHLASDRMAYGDGIVIDQHFIGDIVEAIQRDGLKIGMTI